MARRTAAGHVYRDQPGRCPGAGHPGRCLGLGDRSREQRQSQGQGAGDRTGRQGSCLDAVPFRRLVRRRRSARPIPGGYRPGRARRKRQHDHHLRLRSGNRDAGTESHPVSDQGGVREAAMARMKFLCDADRCIECNACVTACKNEHEVPWGINRRRVVTINDGQPGERSVSMACMHCTDAPCQAVCPVNAFYTTADGVVLHSKDICIGCGYCFYACPFGAPQYPRVGNFGSRGKMDKCTYCAGGPEPDGSPAEYEKYGANRLAEGKLPLCAEMCSTKSLLAGDGEIIAQIYKDRVAKRGYGSGAWGWKTAYRETITS